MVFFCVQHQDDRTLATVLLLGAELFCARADLSYVFFYLTNKTSQNLALFCDKARKEVTRARKKWRVNRSRRRVLLPTS